MAQTQQICLSRQGNSPWGFRLHGGADFASPLVVQKVNIQSPSEAAGLEAGDLILAVNGRDLSSLKHKEALEAIVRAGNSFQLTIQRGAISQQFWKPQVVPVGEMPTKPTQPGQVFTKTSLAAPKQEDSHWDVKHNQTARGFNAQGSGQSLTRPPGQVYNNPSGLYSEDNIRDVLNQQTETLATGVKGINFKQYEKPEKTLPANSEVLKALQEHENSQRGIAGLAELQEDRGSSNGQNFRSVAAPITKPRPEGQPSGPPLSMCGQCGRLITGVFCKVRGQPLHAECFVCSTCKCPLKNIGHYIVNDKIFCEAHALAAKGGQQQQDHHQQPLLQQNHAQTQPQQPKVNQNISQQPPKDWSHVLNANSAGMAANAEEFTRQFMSQMYGSAAPQQQLKVQPTPPSAPVNRPMAQVHSQNQAQTQGILKVNTSDDVITTSNKPKKVGGSFQWPPPKEEEDQGATATPMYINPNQGFGTTSPGFQNDLQQQAYQQHQQHWQQTQNQQHLQQQQNQQQFQQQQNPQHFQQNQQQHHFQEQQHQVEQHQTTRVESSHFQQQHQTKSQASKTLSSPLSILKQTIPVIQPDPVPEPLPSVGPGQNVTAPRRGMGVLKQQQPGMRVPVCGACESQIRGPFITALGRTWCPGHFHCSQATCGKSLQESGFVEEQGHLYCEECYGKYLAPDCEKCRKKILGNCLKAMGKTFHPECFVCAYCGKIFANSPFYLEDNLPYCEEDWNELFTTKCVSCGFPIEAGDRWVEALNNNYHSQCFNCTLCKKNLEGQGFFVKAGKPFCKSHAKLGV